MKLQTTYRGPDTQRFAQEPPPYGAGWPAVAHEAQVILVYGEADIARRKE